MSNITTEQEVYLAGLKAELAITDQEHHYDIVHSMNPVARHLFVAVNLTPQAICGLMAYIEHAAFDYTNANSHTLQEEEMMEIIATFYRDVRYLAQAPSEGHYEVDLYVNWEEHASIPYEEGMPELQREGLHDFIRDLSVKNGWKREYSKK